MAGFATMIIFAESGVKLKKEAYCSKTLVDVSVPPV